MLDLRVVAIPLTPTEFSQLIPGTPYIRPTNGLNQMRIIHTFGKRMIATVSPTVLDGFGRGYVELFLFLSIE